MSYACFNRRPFKESLVVQNGWFMDGVTRTPRMVSIPFRMASDCRYQATDAYADSQCINCAHKKPTGEKE